MPLGVGWQDCQPYPLAHSTHVFHSSPSRTLPWSVHSHHDFGSVGSSRTGFGGGFSLTQTFLGLHELLKHPRTVNRVFAVVLFIHRQNRIFFLLTQDLYCCAFSRTGDFLPFLPSRTGFCRIYPRSSFLLRICG